MQQKTKYEKKIQLASEQATHGFRDLLTAEIIENRIIRLEQRADIEENKKFRSQQTLGLQQNQSQQIEKKLKQDGTFPPPRKA